MKKTIIITAIALFAGILLTGCCQKCRKNKLASMRPIQGTVWQLTELDGEKVNAVDNYEITFLADGRVVGIGECNRFFGKYEIFSEAGSIKISPVGSTMMACPNMELETQFFRQLEKIHLYQFEADNLYMFIDNKIAAKFIPTDKPIEE